MDAMTSAASATRSAAQLITSALVVITPAFSAASRITDRPDSRPSISWPPAEIEYVGSVIAIGPGGVAQAPVRDDRARLVIETVLRLGMLDRKVLSPACASMAEADDLRRAIYRSARYYCGCGRPNCTKKYGNIPREDGTQGCPLGGMRVGCRADVVRDARGAYRVQFSLFDKREAIRHVIERYGPDPEHWPYLAKRKRSKELVNVLS